MIPDHRQEVKDLFNEVNEILERLEWKLENLLTEVKRDQGRYIYADEFREVQSVAARLKTIQKTVWL